MIKWVFPEWLGFSTGTYLPIGSLSALKGGWHSIEVDYWRNGHPSGQPAVGIWLDNKQITMVGRKWADDCDRFLKNKKFFLDIVRGVARVCKEAQKDDRTDVVYTFSSVPA